MSKSLKIGLAFLSLISAASCRKEAKEEHNIINLLSVARQDALKRNLKPILADKELLYVQFLTSITPKIEAEIGQLARDSSRFNKLTQVFIMAENKSDSYFERFDKSQVFIEDQERRIKRAFNAPACCDSFFFLNSRGHIVLRGILHESIIIEVNPYLVAAMEMPGFQDFGKEFRISKLEEIGLPDTFVQTLCINRDDKKYHVVLLLDKLCTECAVWEAIKKIGIYSQNNQSQIDYRVFLPDDFSATDMDNFRASLEIQIPIGQSPPDIQGIWFYLSKRLPLFFTNLALLLDDQGEILDLFDEDKPNSFMATLSQLTENR